MQQSGSILSPWAIDYASGAPEVVPFARHTVHCSCELHTWRLCQIQWHQEVHMHAVLLHNASRNAHSPPARLRWTVRLRHGAPDAFQSPHQGERVPLILGDTRFPFPFSVPSRGRGRGEGAWLETHADERYVMSLEGKSNNLWPRLKSD